MRVRKKPVVVDAVNVDIARDEATVEIPTWYLQAYVSGAIFESEGNLFCRSLEGPMQINPGDYIIRGVKGELYPCKPDIFAITYDVLLEDRQA